MSSLYKHLGPWGKFFFTLYTIGTFSFYGAILYAIWVFIIAPIWALIHPLVLLFIVMIGMGAPYSWIAIGIPAVVIFALIILSGPHYRD